MSSGVPPAIAPAAKLIDISPPITGSIAVFPGDTIVTREVLLDMRHGDNITLSTLRTTVHVGAHADAPSHYGHAGRTIDRQPLDLYIGPCRVIDMPQRPGGRLVPADLPANVPIDQPRVLLRTGSYPDPAQWQDDFTALSPDLIDHLADRGVRLIGIDTPSVDPASAKILEAHHQFLARDVAILEGLALSSAPAGVYELIALPLALVGFDASPVRAVLRALVPNPTPPRPNR